ncbi:unnamed protein product [Phaedon cochleariae]|uniref:THAP-type domain-containing protein n=1 Tax=Phaedon cochleariae TaxID=80249 RepID=A0A9N9SEG2_PHACE|nr:unnamed protein product [Phaedon cochleariae]
MVRRCEVCKRQFDPSYQNTSFHRFPQNAELMKIWEKNIGKENVSNEARICSDHFHISDIMFSPG